MLAAALAGILVALLSAGPVYATHSLPAPREWWDLDNDRTVDEADSNIGFARTGSNWTQERILDFSWGTSVWRGGTRWDPFNSTEAGVSGLASIRLDGLTPAGLACPDETWIPGDYALTCLRWNNRSEGGVVSFRDIFDVDVAFNTGFNVPASQRPWVWSFGDVAQVGNQPHFRGVLVHELGHGISLIGVGTCGTPIATMCEDGVDPDETDDLKDLTLDDINAANTVYPI